MHYIKKSLETRIVNTLYKKETKSSCPVINLLKKCNVNTQKFYLIKKTKYHSLAIVVLYLLLSKPKCVIGSMSLCLIYKKCL